jgi:hypothetical protein
VPLICLVRQGAAYPQGAFVNELLEPAPAKYGEPQGRVAKAVLIAAVPPLMLTTEKNPGSTYPNPLTLAD